MYSHTHFLSPWAIIISPFLSWFPSAGNRCLERGRPHAGDQRGLTCDPSAGRGRIDQGGGGGGAEGGGPSLTLSLSRVHTCILGFGSSLLLCLRLISTIAYSDKNSIDTTNKAMVGEGGNIHTLKRLL